jgi:hypothetical protein
MGEKKQKEKTTAQWKQIVVVGACVLFVVLMIVSGMGSGWISAFSVAKPGDVAVIDYTFYDTANSRQGKISAFVQADHHNFQPVPGAAAFPGPGVHYRLKLVGYQVCPSQA